MPDTPDIVYRINQRDEIVSVSDSWDPFATANAGNQVTSREVVGRPLWDFVTDPSTREIYRQVLARIRRGSTVQYTFRCDSPECRRLLEMTVTGTGNGGVEFRSRTLALEERSPQPLVGAATTDANDLLRLCGWCKRVDAHGDWLDVEEAVAALRLLERSALPQITHGICPACFERMMAVIDAA